MSRRPLPESVYILAHAVCPCIPLGFPSIQTRKEQMAMGQKLVLPVNIPIPTKIDRCTYAKMVPLAVTHSHVERLSLAHLELAAAASP